VVSACRTDSRKEVVSEQVTDCMRDEMKAQVEDAWDGIGIKPRASPGSHQDTSTPRNCNRYVPLSTPLNLHSLFEAATMRFTIAAIATLTSTAAAVGNAIVLNKCTSTIYAWSVGSAVGTEQTLTTGKLFTPATSSCLYPA
jgi:hypothetical protein